MKLKFTIITFLGSLCLLMSNNIQAQPEKRIQSIVVEIPNGSEFIKSDSTVYHWGNGEGASSTNYEGFSNEHYGWYFTHQPFLPITQNYRLLSPQILSDIDVRTEAVRYIWDATLQSYFQGVRNTYELGSNGEVLVKNIEGYNEVEEHWENSWKSEFTYNSNGDMIIVEGYQAPVGVNWENYTKLEMEYDANHRVTQIILSEGMPNQVWKPQKKTIKIYNNEKLKEEHGWLWDSGNAAWNPNKRDSVIYEYNSEGLCNKKTKYTDMYGGGLLLDDEELYWYSNIGMLMTTRISDTNNPLANLKAYYQTQIDYNYTYPISVINYRWNENEDAFVEEYKYTFTYNGELLSKISALEWDAVSNTWKMASHSYFGREATFHYEDVSTTNIDESIIDLEVTVYPNPAAEKINIEVKDKNIQSVQIIDVAGKVVYENQQSIFAKTLTLPTSQFPSGLYYLHLQTDEGKSVKSFLIK